MTLQEDGRIVNQTNNKIFIFRGANGKPKNSQPTIPFNIIGNNPDNTYLFRFSGQIQVVQFGFTIVDDSTDVSDGTGSSAINTVKEQIAYLLDEIFTSDFEDKWQLTMEEVFGNSTPVNGVITDIELDIPVGKPSIRTGVLTFHRGKLVSL